jgi:hypothetical protein
MTDTDITISPDTDTTKPAKDPKTGRFLTGNIGGPGNPLQASIQAWRAQVAKSIKAEDIKEVLAILLAKALSGERWAVKEILDRTLGKPSQSIEITGDDRMDPVDILKIMISSTKVTINEPTDR